MDLMQITEKWTKLNTKYYKGSMLFDSKIYLMPKLHIDQLVNSGFARYVDGYDKLQHFPVSELKAHQSPLKVILFFDGGFGDAISVSVLLDALKTDFNIYFDIICKRETWEHIFLPFGFTGNWIQPPADLDTIDKYKYVQTRIQNFFPDTNGMYDKCIVDELANSYNIDLTNQRLTYDIPSQVIRSQKLPESNKIRMGINFDSNGLIKNYPKALQPVLIKNFLDLGFEIYLFGQDNPEIPEAGNGNSLYDFCGKTTLPELAAMINQMDFILCIDSFIAHLSDIMGIKTIVLLSTTRKGIFNWHKNVICIESHIPCTPCNQVRDKCPLGYEQCKAFFHESISPEIITYAVIKECAQYFRQFMNTSKN